MRKEFWESRVDGIPEMYCALRSVCEAMLNNDSGLADAILQVILILSHTQYVVLVMLYLSCILWIMDQTFVIEAQ
jgi:hypothetical protein